MLRGNPQAVDGRFGLADTLLLFAVSVLPFATHMSGPLYLAGAVLLGAGFAYHAVMLLVSDDPGRPLRTFVYSIHYLMGIFGILLVDHYLPMLARLLVAI